MKQAVFLFVLLMGIWLLFSGHYDPTLVTYGALSCAAVVAITARLGILDAETVPVHLAPRMLLYLPWLFKEIVLSNIDVARAILDPRLPIRPRLIRVRATQSTEIGQVIFANSITLTPGTITLDVRARGLLVQALTEKSAEGLLSGEMNRRVARIDQVAAHAGDAS